MLSSTQSLTAASPASPGVASPQTQEAFASFVGNVFFTQMMKSLRSTSQPTAYIGGSQGEKTFQSQLDQHLAAQMADEHGGRLAKSMQPAFARSLDVRA